MSVNDIDIDFLISLVEERPIIWDKGHEHYNDKFLKSDEWAAICKNLFQDYEEFEDTKKNKIGIEVVKKWRSVKDNFCRCVKKLKESSSVPGAKKIKKYHYYNQLKFLLKAAQNKNDDSLDMEPEEMERNENTTSPDPDPLSTSEMPVLSPGPSRYVPTTTNRKRKSLAIDDFEAQTLEALPEKENRHLSFFKGILPSLNNFTELQTLKFQSKVINIITEIYGEQSRRYQSRQQYQSASQLRRYQTGIQTRSTSRDQTGLQTQTGDQTTHSSNFTDDNPESPEEKPRMERCGIYFIDKSTALK